MFGRQLILKGTDYTCCDCPTSERWRLRFINVKVLSPIAKQSATVCKRRRQAEDFNKLVGPGAAMPFGKQTIILGEHNRGTLLNMVGQEGCGRYGMVF